MIAFLKSGQLKPPHAVATTPGAEAAGAGFVTADFAVGTLFLACGTGRPYRLEWARPRPSGGGRPVGSASRRALPPGEYTLTGYRVVRRDAKGVEWFLSATGPDLRRLVVRAGEEQRVKVGDTIHLTGGAHPAEGEVEIELMIAGLKGSGLSIYRGGKRIDIGYRLMSAQGQELARGTLQYG